MFSRRTHLGALLCLAGGLAVLRIVAANEAAKPAAQPPLEITQDTVLDPAKPYGPIVIKASGITIDGQGAWVIGSRQGDPTGFTGVGISAQGVSGVTLKNLNAKGWNVGLKIENGGKLLIENCDFSDNFHDPRHGWGELGRRGGIVLQHVDHSTLRKNKANRVWNGCVLADSDENLLEENDFSHASNTCLSLWTACRNRVLKNNLSYGIRISPGEVHARDSVGLLVEAGSNDNYYVDNDITHGGDGVFVRSLNGWTSSGNVFERNDASYANNNCFEAQSPGNTYRGNKANRGSHGLWLGHSNETVVEDNEACYNGLPDGMHNAPWRFAYAPDGPQDGAAGIIFAGSSNNTICRGNKCVGNNGAGICMFGDASPRHKFTAYHWVLESNVVRDNRWGIYLEFANFIDLAGNDLENNRDGHIVQGGINTNIHEHPGHADITAPPHAALVAPSSAKVGAEVVLDASGSADPAGRPLSYRWDLGDGTTASGPRVTHVFRRVGLYHVGLTVTNGRFSDLAYRNFRAVDDLPELGTEGQAAQWSWDEIAPRQGLHVERGKEAAVGPALPVANPRTKLDISDDLQVRLVGKSSLALRAEPAGNPIRLVYPREKNAAIPLAGKTELVLWCKMFTGNIHAWKGLMPTVTLYESPSKFAQLRPYDDARNWQGGVDWIYKAIPLHGDEVWKLEGELPATVNWLTIEFYPWGDMPVRAWMDGLSLK